MISASLMHEAGHSKLVLWDNPEGWGEEGSGKGIQDGGTHVHLWVIHVDVWQKPPQYCKEIILQLKWINSIFKNGIYDKIVLQNWFWNEICNLFSIAKYILF